MSSSLFWVLAGAEARAKDVGAKSKNCDTSIRTQKSAKNAQRGAKEGPSEWFFYYFNSHLHLPRYFVYQWHDADRNTFTIWRPKIN